MTAQDTAGSADAVADPPDMTLPVVVTIPEYSPIVRDLARLMHQLKGITYDLTNKGQEEAARRDRKLCVSMRGILERTRTEQKADILERGRKIDGEARQIKAAIEAVETPIDDQLQALDRARDAEAERKRNEIAARIDAVRADIAASFDVPADATIESAAEVQARIDAVEAIPINATRFGDLTIEAQEARVAALNSLIHLITMARRREAAAADLARRKAELDEAERVAAARRAEEEKERAAQRQRDDEERQRQDAARRAAQKAEDDAREAEAKKRRDELAAQEKAIADREAAARKRQDELDRAEALRLQKIEDDARAAQQAAEDAERRQRMEALALIGVLQAQVTAAHDAATADGIRGVLSATMARVIPDQYGPMQATVANAQARAIDAIQAALLSARENERRAEANAAAEAAATAENRLRDAAPAMLAALRQWRNAEAMSDDDELTNARISRDAAIAAAIDETTLPRVPT